MVETTKEEKEFVLKTFEVIQEHENADFDIIKSLGAIRRIVSFAKMNKIPIDEIIEWNKEDFGVSK